MSPDGADPLMEKAATLQEKYIELLERRISQLEALVNKEDTKPDKKDQQNEETKAESKEDEPGKEGDKKDDKKDATKGSARYVTAIRSWDKNTAAYKDEIVAESAFKKEEPKNVAYVFRRVVQDVGRGETRGYSEIEIEAPDLIKLLKDEIGNKYPGVNFDGVKVYMQAPFAAIIHNWDRLQERAKTEPEAQVCKDLAHLLSRVENSEELEDYFKTRTANTAGQVVTFETMWTVFAPKTLLVVKPFMGVPQILQVSSPPIPYHRAIMKGITRLWMEAWCWDWNGRQMVRVYYNLKIKKFRGTKAINELEFYPLSYYTGEEQLREQIKKRALKFLNATKFCNQGAEQMLRYEGYAYVAHNKIVAGAKRGNDGDKEGQESNYEEEVGPNAKLVPIRGQIISDALAYLQYAHSGRIHALGAMEQDRIEEPATDIEEEDVFLRVTRGNVEKEMAKSTNDFLILPSRILGYATKEKVWGQFFVDWSLPAEEKNQEKFRQHLQLNDDYKDLIEALVASHEEKKHKQIQDIASEKGKGLVLLFHGPPGVGKTLTAETIAEATGKPLFVVSVAEIGLDASKAERNLERLFNLATRWEAVLLVDEADVFLETRGSATDASRNALVSVLLRVLEYYKGIIILTTNRIKSIDIAVISRIHLAIRYQELKDSEMKKIFNYFLDQLVPDWITNLDEIKAFLHKTGHHYQLNGRQIRNVVSAALAVARHRGTKGLGDGKLTEEELRMVCETTRDFQEDLKDHVAAVRYNNEAGMQSYRRR